MKETKQYTLSKEKLTLIIMNRYFGIKLNGTESVVLSNKGIRIMRLEEWICLLKLKIAINC